MFYDRGGEIIEGKEISDFLFAFMFTLNHISVDYFISRQEEMLNFFFSKLTMKWEFFQIFI